MEKKLTYMKSMMVVMMGLLKADKIELAKSLAASKAETSNDEGPKDKDDEKNGGDDDEQPQDGAGGVDQSEKEASVDGEHRDDVKNGEVREPACAEGEKDEEDVESVPTAKETLTSTPLS